MWKSVHSKVYSGVKKENVWKLWEDVNHWVSWHSDLEYCRLQGAFEVGNHFLLRPKGAPEFKIQITEMEKGRRFTDCTRFFGAKMYDTHELEETPEGVRLTNTLCVTGPLGWFWTAVVAKNVAKGVPHENDSLVELARRADA